MSVPIGVNFTSFLSSALWISPDIWSNAYISLNNNSKLNLDTTLSADYVPGSNIITVNNPEIFTSPKNYPGQKIQQGFCINTTSGSMAGTATISVGSPYIQVTWTKPTNDISYPSGSYLWFNNNEWKNSSLNPLDWKLPDEYVDGSGRYTSYPQGLNDGQSLYIVPACCNLPTGVYTFIGDGNGVINYYLGNKFNLPGYKGSASIVSGVNISNPVELMPDTYFDWTLFNISSSDTGNPLRNLRLVMDGFTDIYQENKDNPYFFMFHPALLKKLEPFSLIRYMDALKTNNSFVSEWSEKPTYKGTSLGAYYPDGYWEWIPKLAIASNTDLWWCVPNDASDDYIYELANFLYENIIVKNPTSNIKIAVEYSNEVWNWGFAQTAYVNYMNIQLTNLHKVERLFCDRNIVNVYMPNHGFKDKDFILIENCEKDIYNGIFQINYIDNDNFSYSINPSNFYEVVQPKHHHVITAVSSNDPNIDIVESIVWDGYSQITVKTKNPHTFGNQDAIQIFNASDPGFNQLFWVYQVIDSYTFTIKLSTEGFKRSTPNPSINLVVQGVAKNNDLIRLCKIANGHGPGGPGIVSSWEGQNYYAVRSAQINTILHEVFKGYQDRLIFVLSWQVQAPKLNNAFTNILSVYKNELGGSFLPNSEVSIACAPYFSSTDKNLQKTYDSALTINNITNSGNLAVVSIPNHGFASGDSIGIFNINPSDYCGIHNIDLIDNNNFSYNINTTGVLPGKLYDNSINKMFAVKNPPYFREITNISITGNIMFCYSNNHGILDQSGVYICNAPERFFNSPLNGLFTSNVLDNNNFSVTFDSQKYLLPTKGRLWAYSVDAVYDRLKTYVPASSILPYMGALQLTASACPPVTIRCYESGFGDADPYNLSSLLPPYIDLLSQCALSEEMGYIYTDYYNKLYNEYNAKCVNHYSFIDQWSKYGMWGLMQFIDDPITTRYRSIAQFSNKYPIPSGSWNTYSGLVPYFCFDSGHLPYSTTMSLFDIDTNTYIPGNTLVQLPYTYFEPSGIIQSNNYNVYCNASNEIGTTMPTQSVNVKITIQ